VTTTTYSAGPLISWSLPINGAPRARLRQARAQADAALATFDKTVLTALQETEQALARLDGAVRREQALSEAARASEQAADLTQTRFRAGSDSFLQLLDAQRSLASARGQAIAATSDRALAQVSLFKALGGGWQNAPAVETHHP
jgi:outer membrane protein TolC